MTSEDNRDRAGFCNFADVLIVFIVCTLIYEIVKLTGKC